MEPRGATGIRLLIKQYLQTVPTAVIMKYNYVLGTESSQPDKVLAYRSIKEGIHPRCILSLQLFNIYVEGIMRESSEGIQ